MIFDTINRIFSDSKNFEIVQESYSIGINPQMCPNQIEFLIALCGW